MKNGDLKEFVDGLYYGDERVFIYNNEKFFIQGYIDSGKLTLFLDRWEPASYDYVWKMAGTDKNYPVKEFLKAKLFNGKTFYEVEKDIEWIDP